MRHSYSDLILLVMDNGNEMYSFYHVIKDKTILVLYLSLMLHDQTIDISLIFFHI